VVLQAWYFLLACDCCGHGGDQRLAGLWVTLGSGELGREGQAMHAHTVQFFQQVIDLDSMMTKSAVG